MSLSTPEQHPFKTGELVASRNDPAWVGSVISFHGERCRVMQRPGVTRSFDVADLVSMEHVASAPSDDASSGRFCSASQFAAYVTAIRCRRTLSDHLYAFRTGRIDHYAHQYRPIIRLLHGGYRRILIADEVGLGKTIEAGIIHRELSARREVAGVLVVSPATLCIKWQAEMRDRFDVKLKHWQRKDLAQFIEEVRQGRADEMTRAVISLQAARSPKISAQLRELAASGMVPFDLVIIDESHHLRNQESDAFELASELCATSNYVVMLTATPVNLHSQDLFNQLHLLAPDSFPDFWSFEQLNRSGRALREAARLLADGASSDVIHRALVQTSDAPECTLIVQSPSFQDAIELVGQVEPLSAQVRARVMMILKDLDPLGSFVTRTRKREVRIDTMREVHNAVVELSPTERQALTAIEHHARNLRGEQGMVFRAVQMEQMACSCLPAAVQRVIQGDHEDDELLQAELESLLDDDESLDAPDQGARHFDAPHLVVDSKLDALCSVLVRIRQIGLRKAILFTSYRRTLDYLHLNLKGAVKCLRIDGDTSMAQRTELLEQFRDASEGELTLFMMTEVGAEGLDFQFCSCLINYDLPWNPMRIEQRIGRLDRIGQMQKTIHIFNLYVGGTIEDKIFSRLWERIGIFHQSIGALEAILAEHWESLNQLQIRADFSELQLVEWARRVELALEARAKEDEFVRTNADHLLTYSTGEDAAIAEVASNSRFVAPADLEGLLREGLCAHFPGTRFSASDVRPGVAKLTPDAALQQAGVEAACPPSHQRAYAQQRHWLAGDAGAIRLVQFSGQELAATAHEVGPSHLVTQVVSERVLTAPMRWWCPHIQLSATEILPVGEYVFAAAIGRITARMAGESAPRELETYLRAAVLRSDGHELPPEAGNELLAGIRTACQPSRPSVPIDGPILEAVQARADDLLVAELKPRAVLRRARAASHLAVADARHAETIAKLEATMAEQEAGGKLRGAKLARDRIAAARQRFARLRVELEQARNVQVESEVVAIGRIEVA